MRKVIQCFGFVIVMMVVLFSFVGCTEDEADMLYEALVGEGELAEANQRLDSGEESLANEGYDSTENPEANDLPRAESELTGTLHILTNQFDTLLPALAREFRRLHPGVEIRFEEMDFVVDISQQAALATRLLADPRI